MRLPQSPASSTYSLTHSLTAPLSNQSSADAPGHIGRVGTYWQKLLTTRIFAPRNWFWRRLQPRPRSRALTDNSTCSLT